MTPGLKGDTRSRRKAVSHQYQGNINNKAVQDQLSVENGDKI